MTKKKISKQVDTPKKEKTKPPKEESTKQPENKKKKGSSSLLDYLNS